MTDQAIVADGLTKRYGEELAVSGLSLSIPAGDVYGFLGPNGAGKTTTMRMLTGLTQPTDGTATVAGAAVDERPALTERIGYLPADPPVFDELTGREHLRYVARLHELPPEEAGERIDDMLARFDLADDADRRVGTYSTGMQKKVGAIAALLGDPEVVFLDEPTSGLDPRAARTMRDTVAAVAERDVTVFLSSHVLSVVDELADTVGVIDDGELVAEGATEELKRRARDDGEADLETAFLDITEEAHAPDERVEA
ncbi:ABC-type transport system ATP-binding protein [Halosimplex carlsbadense 2-9-1]|uniref:ABC-type transport system ATP-binding protein n=1 Tax=Halosimplex carlsbadense 2-9-1 TaxID=797114 RepID=M0CAB3_9EURY|nr:ABC transporter ATP-binding protein [Halosimplex carlsbadense]ELZ20236.1 ABC-type transport system ATP-binding protein [Halosimplex carlsbadense 2-9-1]